VPRLLIVDGQQRLTSLYTVLKGKPVLTADYREERIKIAFRPSDGRFEVANATTERDPEVRRRHLSAVARRRHACVLAGSMSSSNDWPSIAPYRQPGPALTSTVRPIRSPIARPPCGPCLPPVFKWAADSPVKPSSTPARPMNGPFAARRDEWTSLR